MRKLTWIILFTGSVCISDLWADWTTPEAGKLLVADSTLQDPRFVQSVVLLFHYDKEGAAGLILNHPTQAAISNVFPEMPGVAKRKDLLHFGGPVSIESIFLLVDTRDREEKAEHVFENIFISTDRPLMQKLIGKLGNEKHLRFYAGYAGWGAGQLQFEIAGGYWHVLPGDTKAIFHGNPTEVWRELLERSNVIQAQLNQPINHGGATVSVASAGSRK
ncbi:MAG TPA: YqgE/AlgH family protein [Acidobacteriota bacterium]|nr:YqgE/AlgH family protein [Acidobacteriota bacterium]